MSQEALAAKVGLTQGMISQLEKGTSDYTGNHLEIMSKALNCTRFDLLFRDPAWPESPVSVIEGLSEEDKAFAVDMLKTIRNRRTG